MVVESCALRAGVAEASEAPAQPLPKSHSGIRRSFILMQPSSSLVSCSPAAKDICQARAWFVTFDRRAVMMSR